MQRSVTVFAKIVSSPFLCLKEVPFDADDVAQIEFFLDEFERGDLFGRWQGRAPWLIAVAHDLDAARFILNVGKGVFPHGAKRTSRPETKTCWVLPEPPHHRDGPPLFLRLRGQICSASFVYGRILEGRGRFLRPVFPRACGTGFGILRGFDIRDGKRHNPTQLRLSGYLFSPLFV